MDAGVGPVVGLPSVDHIAFVGLMASGKSSVGGLVAERFERPLVDVDDLIERQTGMTVKELWERGGEGAYRPLERDAVIHTLSERGPDVLAVPAGAVLDHLVTEAFEASDVFVVWLRAEPETLAEQAESGGHRPLLGDDPLAALRTMATERAAAYAALAHLTLDIDERSPDELAGLVIAAVAGRS
ncbi:MAG: shikimate kinase [Acidimicrobiales bacterium]